MISRFLLIFSLFPCVCVSSFCDFRNLVFLCVSFFPVSQDGMCVFVILMVFIWFLSLLFNLVDSLFWNITNKGDTNWTDDVAHKLTLKSHSRLLILILCLLFTFFTQKFVRKPFVKQGKTSLKAISSKVLFVVDSFLKLTQPLCYYIWMFMLSCFLFLKTFLIRKICSPPICQNISMLIPFSVYQLHD